MVVEIHAEESHAPMIFPRMNQWRDEVNNTQRETLGRLMLACLLVGVGLGGTMPKANAAEPFYCDVRKVDGPMMLPWKSFKPDRSFHGQWLVAADVDNDGQAEIITARHVEQDVKTVLVSKLDGRKLWSWGKPGAGNPGLWHDVPVCTYDLDGDGKQEVWLSAEHSLIVLQGSDGRELRRLPLPQDLNVSDCITFANLRGLPRARDIIIKDRYNRLWAYTDDWKPLWFWKPAKGLTCHHPTPVDINGDGKDEVLVAYTMLAADGKELWTITSKADLHKGHMDACEVVRTGKKPEDTRLIVTYCGSNGIAMVDGNGKTLWEQLGHHYESPDAGRMRSDVPGVQVIVDYDHLPFGRSILGLFSEQGVMLGKYECDFGRHHRLLDWDGDGLLDLIIGNTMRVCDGKGRCISRLGPAEAFADVRGEQPVGNDPGPFVVAADVDGDERPEIILHSVNDVMIYRNDKAARVPGMRLGTDINFSLY